MTDDPNDLWCDELEDLERRSRLPLGPQPHWAFDNHQPIDIDPDELAFRREARKFLVRFASLHCRCKGTAPIWYDDHSGASSSWDRVVRLYEDLR